MRVAYIGNFEPEHSTENDLRDTMRQMGVDVEPLQEGTRQTLSFLDRQGAGSVFDLVLWTSTKGLADKWPQHEQRFLLWELRMAGIPTAAIHLDRWWGLERQHNVLSEPWFGCDYVFTADGAHQKEFEAARVNHWWMPPAIAPKNAHRGQRREEFVSDIAFVGNHFPGHYHDEWQHRGQLVQWLNRNYRGRVVFYPRRTGRDIEPAIRGDDLADLYASAKVIVGDSCLVPTVSGEPMHHYVSDRVFETVGRGGLLIHPHVHGVTGMAVNTLDDAMLVDGEHLLTWPLGEWDLLRDRIEWALSEPTAAEDIRRTGHLHVRQSHTYRNRLTQLFRITNGVEIP